MIALDLNAIRERFLPACVHDISVIENACTCRRTDPRWAIAELVAEVERLRAALDDIRVLHVDSPAGFCPSCGRLGDVSDTDDGLVAWPCPTIRVIKTVTEEATQ